MFWVRSITEKSLNWNLNIEEWWIMGFTNVTDSFVFQLWFHTDWRASTLEDDTTQKLTCMGEAKYIEHWYILSLKVCTKVDFFVF